MELICYDEHDTFSLTPEQVKEKCERMCYYSLPQVVPVLGEPMTTLPPPGRISTMSFLVLLHVVEEEGFPRPIVEPGLASIRSLLPQVVPVLGEPMTTLPPPGRMSMIFLLDFPQVVPVDGSPMTIVEPGVGVSTRSLLPHVVPVLGSPLTTLPPPGRMSMMSRLGFPHVVPVDGSPMMIVEPGAGVSMMSRLDLPHVVLEEGFPRPIVEPGVVEMRSGWGLGLVFMYLCIYIFE